MDFFSRYIFLTLLLTIQVVFSDVFPQPKVPLENISLTDINGNVYVLFDELEAGKTVVFDFFSYYCSACQINTPHIDSVWQNNGGGDSVWVWGIETSGYDSAMVQNFAITYGATFPVFSTKDGANLQTEEPHITLLEMFNITGTPTYVVVCPDFTWQKYTADFVQSGIDQCVTQSVTEIQTEYNFRYAVYADHIEIREYADFSPAVEISIYDVLGREYSHLKLNTGDDLIRIETAGLPPGIYFLKMEITGIRICKRLLISRQ